MRTLIALLLAGLFAPAAHAAWGPPAVLASGEGSGLRATTVLPDGRLRAATVGPAFELGFVDGPPFGNPVVALRRPDFASYVAFAADGSGIAVGDGLIYALDPAGTARPALQGVGDDPAIGMSPAGAAAAAWVDKTTEGYAVMAAFRDPGAATFGAPVRAGYAPTRRNVLSIGIADSGEAVVVWQTNGFPSDAAAAVRLPGASFSPARFVSRGASDAQLAVGPGGQAILAVARGRSLDVSVKAPGVSAMPTAKRVDRGEGYAVDVAAAGPNRVAMAWVAAVKHGKPRVRVYDGLRRIATLGHDATGEDIELGIDQVGADVVAWEDTFHRKTRVGVAYRPAGKRFGTPAYLGPSSLFASPESVQVAPGGHAWALWQARGRVYVTEHTP